MSAREYLECKKGTLRDVHYAHMDIIMKQFNLQNKYGYRGS